MGSGSAPPPPEGLAEGQTLAGKYQLLRQLGAGGMCLVYEAEHVHLKQAVALKVLKPELANDPDSVARFSREAQAAAKLRSANVARVYDVDHLADGQPYITMELLVGHDLGTELQRRGALPQPLAVDYVRQACAGIAEAHALGIIHRDLKPENLFLTELGAMTDRKLVKILDFGIAKNISESQRRLTAPDAVFGTVDYMSPEQIRSASTVDSRTDIWSLGVILYELLTGQLPYSGDARAVIAQIASDPLPPPSRLKPSLPPSLVAVVMKALAKDPAARWQSADELRDALEPFADIEPITGVLARLPPHSVPRRTLDTPMKPVASPAAVAGAGADGAPREMRTNVSWAGEPTPRGVSRMWLAGFALAVILSAGGTTAYLKRDSIAARFGTPPASPAHTPAKTDPAAFPPPPPIPAPVDPAAGEPATPSTAMATAMAPATTTAEATTPVTSVTTTPRTRPATTTRPKAPPPPPPRKPPEPAPTPSPTPSPALPKHL
jgi:eukaryotic-like serine/threonine-protein kinase